MVSGTVNILYGLIELFIVVGVGRDECIDDNDAGQFVAGVVKDRVLQSIGVQFLAFVVADCG